MDLPIIVIDVIFWSGALCNNPAKNIAIAYVNSSTGCNSGVQKRWHDQETYQIAQYDFFNY